MNEEKEKEQNVEDATIVEKEAAHFIKSEVRRTMKRMKS